MEFTPIETQEALDEILRSRIERNTAQVTAEVKKNYEGYLSPDEVDKLKQKAADITAELDKAKGELKEAQENEKKAQLTAAKLKIAQEYGVPFELAERLNGTTEEELKADAEVFAGYTAPKRSTPAFNSETNPPQDKKKAEMKALLEDLRQQRE